MKTNFAKFIDSFTGRHINIFPADFFDQFPGQGNHILTEIAFLGNFGFNIKFLLVAGK